MDIDNMKKIIGDAIEKAEAKEEVIDEMWGAEE